MPALNHTHSYIKWRKRGNPVEMHWKCADPDCTHTIAQSLVIGKNSLCPACTAVIFKLTWEDDLLRRSIPKCINCRNTRRAKTYQNIQGSLKGLFKEDERKDVA